MNFNNTLDSHSEELGKMLCRIESIQSKTNRQFVKNVETPWGTLLRQDLPGAQAYKRKLESRGKVKSGQDPVVTETMAALQECQEKCHRQLLHGMCSIMEEYYSQYEQGHTLVHRLLPTMIKYRTECEVMSLQKEGELFRIGERLDIPPSHVLKEGLLEKKGAIRRNWNNRWFVLKSGYLFYFNNKADRILKGFIHLTNCTVTPSFNKKKPHCFVISTALRNLMISATTEQESKQWVSAIKNATVEEERRRLEETHKLQLESLTQSQADEYLNTFILSPKKTSPPKEENEKNETKQTKQKDEKSKGDASARREKLLASMKEEEDDENKIISESQTPKKTKKVSIDTSNESGEPSKPKKKRRKKNSTDTPTGEKKRRKKRKVETKDSVEGAENSAELSTKTEDNSGTEKGEIENTKNEMVEPDFPAPTPIPEIKEEETKSEETPKKVDDDDEDDDFDESGIEEDDEEEELFSTMRGDRKSRKAVALSLLNDDPDIIEKNEVEEDNTGKEDNAETDSAESSSIAETVTPAKPSGRPPSYPDTLFKQGYLMKKGAKRRNWTTRWFILRFNHLAYYKNPGVCLFINLFKFEKRLTILFNFHRIVNQKVL